jgi:hypothetical protein
LELRLRWIRIHLEDEGLIIRVKSISDKQLLTLLIGAAIGAGGWIYRGEFSSRAGSVSIEELDNQLRIAQEEIEILAQENASLRSLAQGGGEVSIPKELISKVEREYGLKFLSNPKVNRVATEELSYRVEAALESRLGPQGFDDRQEAYQRIGWLRSTDRLLDQLVAVRSVGAIAWFDEQLGEGWVTDKFNSKNIPDQAAIVRILVRMLLNQHYPAPVTYPGDDAARAREAFHAGAASGAESRYLTDSARTIGFMPMHNNGAVERLMLSLPPFIQGLTMFPVVSGRAMTDTLYIKGDSTFSDRLRNPPQNTYSIVFPSEEPQGERMDLPKLKSEIFLTENAGYLGLKLWLEEMGDVGIAEEIAREWSRDRYILFAEGEKSSGLIWEIEFQTANAAEQFLVKANQRVLAMKELDVDRFFGVKRVSEKRVRFLNTATTDTLSELLKK